MNKATVAVLISGRGSNLASLIKNAKNYEICAVLSNKDAPGLGFAKEANIPTYAMKRSEFTSVQDQKKAIFKKVAAINPDYVALAGYMQIVEEYFIDHFMGKIVNIHPSLLPKFPGLNTHQRAIEAGESVHGATVHFVDYGVDTGPIIAQILCPVEKTDSEERLAEKVLEKEHILYPWVLNKLAAKDIWLDLTSNKVCYSDRAIEEAQLKGIKLIIDRPHC